MSDLTSYKYFLMQVTKNNHFKKRTIVPRRPPTRTSGLAMSTVWKSMPLYCENSSMNAPNSKKQASAAEPMEYPWKKRKKGKKEKKKERKKKSVKRFVNQRRSSLLLGIQYIKTTKQNIYYTLVIAFVTFPAASRRSVASRTRSG